jgi:hypothetical protein
MERIEPTLLDVFPLLCGNSFAFLGPAPLGEQLLDVGRPALCVTSLSVAPALDDVQCVADAGGAIADDRGELGIGCPRGAAHETKPPALE